MSNIFYIRSGDQNPKMLSRLLDGAGNDIAVAGSEVKFYLIKAGVLTEKAVTYDSGTKLASVTFTGSDFPDSGGRYKGYFYVVDLKLSVPNYDPDMVQLLVAKDWNA